MSGACGGGVGLNCRQANRLLSAYLDRELSGDEMLAVREHVNQCTECSVELEQTRKLKSLLSSARTVKPDPSVYSRVKESVYGPTMTKVQRQRGWALLALTACASALTAAMVFAKAEEAKTPGPETGAVATESEPISPSGAVPMYTVKY